MSRTITIGYCMCGSFCTLSQSITVLHDLADKDYLVHPIMSEITYSTDTRFGRCEDIRNRIENICGRPVLHTIPQVEPIGPRGYLDALIVAPCTGNTLGKLAGGIYDTSVTHIITLYFKPKERNCYRHWARQADYLVSSAAIGTMLALPKNSSQCL